MNIIAATNFSALSKNAVEYAASIAKLANAKLIVYHAYSLPIHASNAHLSAHNFQNMLNASVLSIKKEANRLSEKYGIETEPECSYSFIEDGFSYLIDKYKPSLIVMGMTEKSIEQDLMGNSTTYAIKNFNTPVLAIPHGAKFENTKRLLFACDILQEVPENVLAQIREAAERLNGIIEVFSVNDTITELKKENSDALAINAIDTALQGINYYYKNVRSNAVIEEIEKEIKEFKADLLIMVPKTYGFWSSIVHRSKTRLMASGLDIPLLSIPI